MTTKFSPQDCKIFAASLKMQLDIYKKYGVDKTQPKFYEKTLKTYEILKEVKDDKPTNFASSNST